MHLAKFKSSHHNCHSTRSLRLSSTNLLSAPFAHHLALAVSASQPLKSGTLSLHLSIPLPVLTPFVVTSRPTTASRPSNPLNPSPLALQIWLCWPLCAFINYIYLLTTSGLVWSFPRPPLSKSLERRHADSVTQVTSWSLVGCANVDV